MYSLPWINNINKTDILPPLNVKKRIKNSEKWQVAVMDSFEQIGHDQFRENLKFWDYYRMVDGKMSYQELKEAIPNLGSVQDLLDGVNVPTFLKHYDILGGIINDLVGRYIDLQDKFHVIDTGEIAENEYQRYKNEQIDKALQDLIENEVNLHLAQNGYQQDVTQFNSPEEQKQYVQMLEQKKADFTPKDTQRASKSKFKTIGIQWGEATLEKDKEMMGLNAKEKMEFRDTLLTGRCFREYRIGYDTYSAHTWSPKTTFFSKEIESEYVQDGQFVGRWQPQTPAEVIKNYGQYITTDTQKKLMGGNESWKTFVGDVPFSGSIMQAMESNFNVPTTFPFSGYTDYNFMLGLQDSLGIPMGQMTLFNKDGSENKVSRYLPRITDRTTGAYNFYASVLRDDFEHRKDLCWVTEVYFIVPELWGYLTYETETGAIVTEEVTEDILDDFLRDNNIRQTYKESLEEIIEDFEVDTLKWVWRPVCYEGLKVSSGNLDKPLYLYCRPCKHQIKGDSDFDVKLPVAGYIGKPLAPKIMPYQASYNLVMNQIYNLLEKEIGMFFLMDIGLLPDDIPGWGDAEQALLNMRSIAKDIGIMPVATTGDNQKNQNQFNQFSTYNLTSAPAVQYRIQLAEVYKQQAGEVLGSNPAMRAQPTKYVTAEGVQTSQEASFSQVAELYENYAGYNKRALELHLSVAQYCQSNKKDLTVAYTKSDASYEFLRFSDPDFPFRRLGLIPSKDSRKRKDVEIFKDILKNNNTIQSDSLELARLLASDTVTEILEIAQNARAERMEQEQLAHQRQQELVQQQGQQQQALEDTKFQREVFITDKNNDTKIKVAQQNALGRAADKDADQASFDIINKVADSSIKQIEIDKRSEIDTRKLDIVENGQKERLALDFAKLNQQTRELEAKLKMKEMDQTIATLNKN